MSSRIFLTDKEVACILEVSEKTLYRMLRGFFCEKTLLGARQVDIREAAPEMFNGSRRWRVARLASVLGVTPDEIEKRIS